MNGVISSAAQSGEPYDLLPESIKFTHTREQYMWLSDAEKLTLIQSECEPEF